MNHLRVAIKTRIPIGFGAGDCAEDGLYGVYARITTLNDWITKSTELLSCPSGDFNNNCRLDIGDVIGILKTLSW